MLAGVSNKERDLLDKQVLDVLKKHRTPEFTSQSRHAGEKSRGVLWIVKHEVRVQVTQSEVVGAERKNIPTRAASLFAAPGCGAAGGPFRSRLHSRQRNATACTAFFATSSVERASRSLFVRVWGSGFRILSVSGRRFSLEFRVV